MSKREYIQANKDWLETKSKEEGVKALPMMLLMAACASGCSPTMLSTSRFPPFCCAETPAVMARASMIKMTFFMIFLS
jgi:hypothetical protein